MKKLDGLLATYVKALGKESPDLASVAKALLNLKNVRSLSDLAQRLSQVDEPKSDMGPTVGEFVHHIRQTSTVFEPLMTKANRQFIHTLINTLSANPDITAEQVNALSSRPQKDNAMSGDLKLRDYLKRLENSLGDRESFEEVLTALKSDEAMTKAMMVELASIFHSKLPKSTSKAKALEHIFHRQNSLMTFKAKQRAMGGRTAA